VRVGVCVVCVYICVYICVCMKICVYDFELSSLWILLFSCKGHFNCGACGKTIAPTDVHYYCLDSVGYDMHALCHESRPEKNHRVRRFNGSKPNIGVGLQCFFIGSVVCLCGVSRILPFTTHLCTLLV
jgi:hypothetical protein